MIPLDKLPYIAGFVVLLRWLLTKERKLCSEQRSFVFVKVTALLVASCHMAHYILWMRCMCVKFQDTLSVHHGPILDEKFNKSQH